MYYSFIKRRCPAYFRIFSTPNTKARKLFEFRVWKWKKYAEKLFSGENVFPNVWSLAKFWKRSLKNCQYLGKLLAQVSPSNCWNICIKWNAIHLFNLLSTIRCRLCKHLREKMIRAKKIQFKKKLEILNENLLMTWRLEEYSLYIDTRHSSPTHTVTYPSE